MKKYFFLVIFLVAISTIVQAQNIAGTWNGTLNAGGSQLALVFHIVKNDTGYSSSMDSPDQNAFDLKTNSTKFENGKLTIVLNAAKIEYTAILNEANIFEGTFKQGTFSAPLNLTTQKGEKKKPNRPQEPKEPFSYYTEDVVFKNEKENIELSGTLTLPKKDGKYPIVILVSGSGPQDRNEELLGHKPFLVIADYLTKNGIGVLRYDDRGVGKSKGDFNTATSKDFAEDANAAVNYLKQRKEIGKIGIIGHSEGGLIAPIVATQNKNVDFIILLAGPGVSGEKILLAQTALIAKANGATKEDVTKTNTLNAKIFALVKEAINKTQLEKDLTTLLKNEIKNIPKSEMPEGMKEDDFIQQQVTSLANDWIMYFIKYDPTATLKKVKCPVLALNGSTDLQVPSLMNLQAIKKAITSNGNKNVITKELYGLNHLFQESTTGNPNEYGNIEQTIAPIVLEEVLKFVLFVTKIVK